jgi:methanogenic corrinoid protein MtbC1
VEGHRGLLSIGDLCAETGLSADVIRVWERRYGFPEPIRLPSGHRRYRPEDLHRLRLLAEAVAAGHRPSAVARCDEAALRQLLHREGGTELDPLLGAVGAMDSPSLRRLLSEAQQRRGWKAFLQEVVSPLLDRVGVAWAEGRLGIHHEHLVTEVLEDLLREQRLACPLLPDGGAVLLATLPGERHRLGLLMAALAYAASGLRTELLGVDLPVASIAAAARTLKVDRVALSLSVQRSGEPARQLLMDLQARLPPGCRLLIGGQGAARIRKVEGVERRLGLEVI